MVAYSQQLALRNSTFVIGPTAVAQVETDSPLAKHLDVQLLRMRQKSPVDAKPALPHDHLITGYRDAVLYGAWVPGHWWLVLLLESVVVLWAGYRIFQHYDRRVIKFL